MEEEPERVTEDDLDQLRKQLKKHTEEHVAEYVGGEIDGLRDELQDSIAETDSNLTSEIESLEWRLECKVKKLLGDFETRQEIQHKMRMAEIRRLQQPKRRAPTIPKRLCKRPKT